MLFPAPLPRSLPHPHPNPSAVLVRKSRKPEPGFRVCMGDGRIKQAALLDSHEERPDTFRPSEISHTAQYISPKVAFGKGKAHKAGIIK